MGCTRRECLTILDQGPIHYCHECADTKPEVIVALDAAYGRDQLEIMHDQAVSSEICAACHRPIAEVEAALGIYEAEVTITIQCRMQIEARSETQARYSLLYVLDTRTFESVQDEVATVLAQGVRGAQDAQADDCWYDLETITKVEDAEDEEDA